MYLDDMLLKNLNIFTEIHFKNLSFVGNQFILFSSFISIWALLSRFKQYLIHLFWDAWIFLDSCLLSEGYQARTIQILGFS